MSTEDKIILMPREAAKYVAEHSVDVTIRNDGVEETAALIVNSIKSKDFQFDVGRWTTHSLNPKTGDKDAIDWIFLSDLLNFSFWSDDESAKFTVNYGGEAWTGYWSLCACINRALDAGVPFTKPTFYRNITLNELKHLLRSDSDTPMPMIEERLHVLHEAGRVLCEDHGGSFINILLRADKSARKLVNLVTLQLTSFNDVTEFKGQKIAIFKRAQILVADIWACCKGQGYGEFKDIDEITMFADYRIPQCLSWFNALQYSPALMALLHKDHAFRSGERQEVEIRCCSIEAVERIVAAARARVAADPDLYPAQHPVNAILVDHFLWDYRRAHARETQHIPIHKIRCIYY